MVKLLNANKSGSLRIEENKHEDISETHSLKKSGVLQRKSDKHVVEHFN